MSRFIGARVRSVSGIRGQIKKALAAPHAPGTFRATFEDKLLMSDIVFMRTWYPVSPVVYFNPVQSHWLPAGQVWFGMKTVGQLRYERNLPTPHKPDSEYREIERPVERQFNPLVVPRKLEQALPFEEKMKSVAPRRPQKKARTDPGAIPEGRIVVRDKAERARDELLSNVELLRVEKMKREQVRTNEKIAKRAKEKAEDKERLEAFIKKTRKQDLVRAARRGESSKKQKRSGGEEMN